MRQQAPKTSFDLAECIGRGLYLVSKAARYRPSLRDLTVFALGAAAYAAMHGAFAPEDATDGAAPPAPAMTPLVIPAPLPDESSRLDPSANPALYSMVGMSHGFMSLPAPGFDPSKLGEQILEVAYGNSLLTLLVNSGAELEEARNIVAAYKPHYNMRNLRVGQELRLNFEPTDDGAVVLTAATLEASPEIQLVALRTPDGDFTAKEVALPLHKEVVQATGEIQSSLSEAVMRAGASNRVLGSMIKEFSYNVDFQRDLHPRDQFTMLYERYVTPEGKVARQGELLYASLNLQGKELEIYRFESNGQVSYYDKNGKSVRKSLLRTPIDGARISSGFGMRRHPILGYSKMHKGMDFAAPPGTPIFAAGDGLVDFAGPNGSYGNYVRLTHSSGYKTAYAHATRIAKGVKRGTRVKQGQVIAYVGTTGRSTGPHLHFEILRAGVQINPKSVKAMPTDQLQGTSLAQFKTHQRMIEASLRSTPSKNKVILTARNETSDI